MRVVQCNNGHFFDMDAYPVCPVCGASVKEKVQAVSGKGKKGWFGGKKGKDQEPKETSFSPVPERKEDPTPYEPGPIPSSTPVTGGNSNPPVPPTGGKTLDWWDIHSGEGEKKQSHESEKAAVLDSSNSADGAEEPAEKGQNDNGSLRDAVKAASASSAGKTVGYFDARQGNDDPKESKGETRKRVDPVVGWLICVGGAHFGESFPISSGMNSIGRSESNSIVLSEDNSVSREKHAFVIYEPHSRQFFIKPGESSGLTYLNGEIVLESKALAKWNEIQLGENGKFLFLPLCGEEFSWENYIGGNQ